MIFGLICSGLLHCFSLHSSPSHNSTLHQHLGLPQKKYPTNFAQLGSSPLAQTTLNRICSSFMKILNKIYQRTFLQREKADLVIWKKPHSFNLLIFNMYISFPGGSDGEESVKNSDGEEFPGSRRPLEKGMASHSSILAWRVPWTKEPGGLQFMGSQRIGHDWVTMPRNMYFIFWTYNSKKLSTLLLQRTFSYLNINTAI